VSDRVPVSAVLITRDADRHLERVLQPLRVCAEIVVLDSGSQDRTQEIAIAAGARWHCHRFDGYGSQKRRAVALARNDWVLSIDADEVLDGAAREAIAGIGWGTQDPLACWRIRRRPFIGSTEIRHGHWVPDLVVRLFHRSHHDFTDDDIHESVRPTGPVHTLAGSLLHYSYRDLAEVFRVDYHRLKAERYRRQGRRVSGPALALRAAAVFLRSYLLRRGFLDGPAGVVVALSGAAGAVTGLAMATERSSSGNAKTSLRVDE
jgi:glycosyltransferase involved in cell wall biosynthesis